MIVTGFVTLESAHSNIKGAAVYWTVGSPEKARAFLLPPKRGDRCLRRQLQTTFALRRDLGSTVLAAGNRLHSPA